MNLINCYLTNSTWYKGAKRNGRPIGVLWHDTAAGNPNLKRYVQPSEDDEHYAELMKILGTNVYKNDWNHKARNAGVNAFIGKLADGSVATVKTGDWTIYPWGCGNGTVGSCNGYLINKKGQSVWTEDFWLQFEICDDGYKSETYFNQVYKEACELTAYLCKEFGIDPEGTVEYGGVKVPTILCHKDSYILKLGSNHSDVYGWFKKFGKTMVDVRKDVKKIITDSVEPSDIPVGSIVKIAPNATYMDFGLIPKWVINTAWKVESGKGNRIVLGYSWDDSEYLGKTICSRYLTVLEFDDVPFKVRLTNPFTEIRKGPGTNYAFKKYITDLGVYTIVSEAPGQGSDSLWGFLKSGSGWINLDDTELY